MKKDLLKLQILQAGVQNAIALSGRFDFSEIEERSLQFFAQDCLRVLYSVPALLDKVEKIIIDQRLDHRKIKEIAHEFIKIKERAGLLKDDKDDKDDKDVLDVLDVANLDILVLKQYLKRIIEVIEDINLVSFVFDTCVRMK